MSLIVWSWLFLVVYLGGMLAFGVIGRNRVQGADDFATARAAYGPFFLALAFAATTASGATFLGFPGLAYEHGTAALLSAVLYPAGVYLGVLICMRLVANVGDRFGSRSIPEFLGDRYQSDGIRVIVTVASLLLFFYLAGQLLSGLVMFETMLGLSPAWALGITAVVLMIYVSLGGAHADILTDGVQGFLMLVIGVLVIILFVVGAGLDGGFGSVISSIRSAGPEPGRLDQPLDTALPLLVVADGGAARPHSARTVAAHRQQDLGAQDRQVAFHLPSLRFRLRRHAGHARPPAAPWRGPCSEAACTKRDRLRTRRCRRCSSSSSRPGWRR